MEAVAAAKTIVLQEDCTPLTRPQQAAYTASAPLSRPTLGDSIRLTEVSTIHTHTLTHYHLYLLL